MSQAIYQKTQSGLVTGHFLADALWIFYRWDFDGWTDNQRKLLFEIYDILNTPYL